MNSLEKVFSERSDLQILNMWREISDINLPQKKSFNLGVAATFTVEQLLPYLGVCLYENGFTAPQINVAPYNQLIQTCFNYKAQFNGKAPNAILLLWRIENLIPELDQLIWDDANIIPNLIERITELVAAVKHLSTKFNGCILISLPEYPISQFLSLHDYVLQRKLQGIMIQARQMIMVELGNTSNITTIDIDNSLRLVGAKNAYDSRSAYLYRSPYSKIMMKQVAWDIVHCLNVKFLPTKKCLVLDCDNTLWGGIVGEDSIFGLELGNDFPGSVFKDFQRQVLNLQKRGILLALCSKNNENDVWEVFEQHDEMVLKREHLAAWRINWQSKAVNIASLSKELNIGLDSFVFVDDNPTEISAIQSALPEVSCISVPEELADFPSFFAEHRFFDALSITQEDSLRTVMTQHEQERRKLQGELNTQDFFSSLRLCVNVKEGKEIELERITQLINKTNQFNLSTVRKTIEDVKHIFDSDKWKIFTLRVSDKFGDYGLVGVSLVKYDTDTAELETYLLSCRVLGRGVEDAFLNCIGKNMALSGICKMRAIFIPTPKNALAANFLKEQNFLYKGDNLWEINIDNLKAPPSYLQIDESCAME